MDEQTQKPTTTTIVASRVPTSFADELRRRADARGVTLSDVIRLALTDHDQAEGNG